MEGKEAAMAQARPVPIREDCWSEAATFTLIEAWGDRYLELNRGNLRQKHWQEVADAVNARHGAVKKQRRTDVQCKNRIDTLKKKYKIEKARVSSTWPFFPSLDALIGTTAASSKKPSPAPTPPPPPPPPPLALPLPHRKIPPSLPQAAAAARSTKEKRSRSRSPEAVPVDDSFFRRNYSAEAAAAAADSGSSRSSTESRQRNGDGDGDDGAVDGCRLLARAIKRFGEIYKRVEGAKQKQMIELEKQRMEFAKGLEFQRMQLFMDSQVQLEKIKRTKRASAGEIIA